MMLCLFEDDQVAHLEPLVSTRAVYALRLGIRTIYENSRAVFGTPALHARAQVAATTAQAFGVPVNALVADQDVLFVNGRYVAEVGPVLDRFRRAARPGEPGRVFMQGEEVVAAYVPDADPGLLTGGILTRASFGNLPEESVSGACLIGRLWHLLDALPVALERDFETLAGTYNIFERPGTDIHESVRFVDGERVFIAPGAQILPGAVLNASTGPIYIDECATVMEQAVVRGPAYLGPHGQIKAGANVEGSAIGPWSKVGGEVYHSILHGFSNKAHAGFLGDAYVGQWCNLGADTNNSNLKNDYGPVKLYNMNLGNFELTDRQFLGLFMGDHSKCGINTMFNTGTVVGVSCNLYGSGYQPSFVPSFLWGSPDKRYITYRLPKAMHVAERVMARRNVLFSNVDRELLTTVFEATESLRGGFRG